MIAIEAIILRVAKDGDMKSREAIRVEKIKQFPLFLQKEILKEMKEIILDLEARIEKYDDKKEFR